MEKQQFQNSNAQKNAELEYVPTMLDLFSGAGGTGYGFIKAGFKIVGAVELNPNAAETYKQNLKVNVKTIDIRILQPAKFRKELRLRRKQLDVLVGCPPCQGFSRIRNGHGQNDERNDLVLSYLEFVAEFNPRYAVFENVPGILRYDYARAFYNKLNEGLEILGYSIQTFEEDAANYGTPQHRRRVVVVAARKGQKMLQPRRTHGDPRSKEVINGNLLPWRTVRDAIGNNKYPALSAGQNGEQDGKYPNHIAPRIISERVLNFIKDVPHDGGSRTDVPKERWLKCHLDSSGFIDVYGRLFWNKPSNTLTCGCTNLSKGRYVHPEQDRALTYREAAALQGFDEKFKFYGEEISKQIGNAVTPQLSEALANTAKENIFTSLRSGKKSKAVVKGINHNLELGERRPNEKNPKVVRI
ncbi:MAG: DNA cytosine methyltransferase [Pyrinomonadaceae bacterium]